MKIQIFIYNYQNLTTVVNILIFVLIFNFILTKIYIVSFKKKLPRNEIFRNFHSRWLERPGNSQVKSVDEKLQSKVVLTVTIVRIQLFKAFHMKPSKMTQFFQNIWWNSTLDLHREMNAKCLRPVKLNTMLCMYWICISVQTCFFNVDR